MKIAMFLPKLTGGGSERITLTLAHAFGCKGVEIDLVVAKAGGSLQTQVPNKVRQIYLDAGNRISAVVKLASYLRKEHPDLVYTAMYWAGPVIVTAQKLSLIDVRTAVEIESPLSMVHDNGSFLRRWMKWLWFNLIFRKTDVILPVSEGVRDDLVQYLHIPKEKVHTIYNPVVCPEIYEKAKQPVDHPFFAPNAPPTIIGMGRLGNPKDFATLVRAFSRLRENYQARLIILGEGEERPKLESLVSDLELESEVLLPGFAQNPYKYLARASVFVLSSAWEGFGNVLVEAMAFGIPVVSTNCPGGPAEILENGKWGKLIPVGDDATMANAIKNTLENEVDSQALKKRAQDFSIDSILPRYEKVLLR